MLTREELNQMNHLTISNPEYQYLFDKTEQEYRHISKGISHCLRNDLTLITSSIPFIESSQPELLNSRHWAICKKGARYIQEFIEQFSDFSKSAVITCQPVKLDQILTELVRSVKSKHYSLPVSINLQIMDSCPEIHGDADKLCHALNLLIDNSYEAVPERTGAITITLSRSKGLCKITVSDNGCGFSPEMKENLWIPFSSDKNHHIGLGLCTANRIILAHGGHIKLVRSDLNGTSFDICLPV